MRDTCGASCPRRVINPHMHCSTSHPCPAPAHHRYGNDSNGTFTPVSLSVTHFHLLAALRHHLNVIPMVHRVRCTLSIHKCTALNYIPVWHLHTTDMVIRVTVSSHQFHYQSPISIC